MTPEQAIMCAQPFFTTPIDTCNVVEGSGNNRLFKVSSAGQPYALKWYPEQSSDTRDRLNTEFKALTFLTSNGNFPCPKALFADSTKQIALYEWVDGERPEQIQDVHIDAAIDFVESLYTISKSDAALENNMASESCLSLNILETQIKGRFEHLRSVSKEHPALEKFLKTTFQPLFERTMADAIAGYQIAGLSKEQDIGTSQRTLSSSDFGFHNTLVNSTKGVVFIDFEYFGWDDPVKLLSDFLLHPGMSPSAKQCEKFYTKVSAIFSADPEFITRFRLQFPLFALRWSMILLSEFLPERLHRRKLAGFTMDAREKQSIQLAKAKTILKRVVYDAPF